MENCIFCKIVAKELPSTITYEDDTLLAFLNINPVTLGHLLLIPKTHYRWFEEMPDELSSHVFNIAKQLTKEMKKKEGTDYVHLSIVGKDVPHVHVHLIPRKLSENVGV